MPLSIRPLFVTIFALSWVSSLSGGAEDGTMPGVIMTRGKYTRDYMGDWSRLPTGKELAKRDLSKKVVEEVVGEKARKSWANEDEVRIADRSLRVTWNGPAKKMSTTLFTIRECRRVVIENLDIIQGDADYRGYDTFRIEDCDEVIIRNCYFGGTVQSYHLRLEGCARALIEKVEIAGRDYGEKGVRGGGGIFIQNGATGRGGRHGNMIHSPNPRVLEWLTIQHCYLHSLLASEGKHRNQDAILIHSPTEGIVFNCVVEDWDMRHGDAAMDIGFRRIDLKNGFFRVERNIFRNCSLAKSCGGGHSSNTLMWVNNIFTNCFFGDYHGMWPVYHVHNTYLRDDRLPLYKLWGTNKGPAVLENCLIHRTGEQTAWQMIYQNKKGEADRYMNLAFDWNVYLMPQAESWVSGGGVKPLPWENWQGKAGKDAHSTFAPTAPCFVDRTSLDLRLRPGALPAGKGGTRFLRPEASWMKIDRDFLGRSRPSPPSAGAFEPVEAK